MTLIHVQEEKFRALVEEDDKSRWKRIGQMMGKSEVTLRKTAKELGLFNEMSKYQRTFISVDLIYVSLLS